MTRLIIHTDKTINDKATRLIYGEQLPKVTRVNRYKNTDNVPDTIKITKKELRERGTSQTFVGGAVKINCYWFDWQSGEYNENGIVKRFAGYKYMVATMLSKKETFDYMHRLVTLGKVDFNANLIMWIAPTDKDRKKMPLSFNWNAYNVH